MIKESLIILLFILLLSYVFNKKIRAMTIRRPIASIKPPHHSSHYPAHSLESQNGEAKNTILPSPAQHNKEVVDKISKTDPKTIAALITHLAKTDE